MKRRVAPLVGIGGCVAVVGALAAPYVLVRASPGTAVATYYGSGAVSPLFGNVLALVTTVIMAAGRQERTDPVLACGVALSMGVFLFGLTALWALTVPLDVVVGVDAPTAFQYHRWLTTAVAAVVPVASGWWARELGVF